MNDPKQIPAAPPASMISGRDAFLALLAVAGFYTMVRHLRAAMAPEPSHEG